MEKTIYITNTHNLKYYSSKFQRIYFGNEFCQNLIPTPEEIKEVLNFVNKHNIKFSLLTCQVDDFFLKKFLAILPFLRNKDEIILNDWGIFNIIKRKFKNLLPGCILGKFLNNNININQPYCQKFLRKQGLSLISRRRLEIENITLRSCPVNNWKYITNSQFKISLYYPYSYLTTGRYCPTAYCGRGDYQEQILDCQKECQKYTFYANFLNFRNKKIILKGNTWFIKQGLSSYINQFPNIDRLVYMPTIPL